MSMLLAMALLVYPLIVLGAGAGWAVALFAIGSPVGEPAITLIIAGGIGSLLLLWMKYLAMNGPVS